MVIIFFTAYRNHDIYYSSFSANGNGANVPGASDGNADFQFSMLKASLDYDTEIFGSNVSQHVIENNPLSRNISTLSEATSNGETPPGARRKSKKHNQNCNAPGAMMAYAQYTQV